MTKLKNSVRKWYAKRNNLKKGEFDHDDTYVINCIEEYVKENTNEIIKELNELMIFKGILPIGILENYDNFYSEYALTINDSVKVRDLKRIVDKYKVNNELPNV